MVRSFRVRLEDIADAIAGIDALLEGADLAAFSQSWPMQRAVERGLEIISEASRAFPTRRNRTTPTCRGPSSPESATSFATSIIA